LPIIGAIGDKWGVRQGMLLMTPVFLIGALIISSAGNVIVRDIKQVWATAAARSEVAYERRRGRAKLLLVRGLDVAYDGVQVLFGVDFEVDEGEIVALLGTNGAGKSTLLKAISGVVEADRGVVVFDGREMTHAPPNEIAGRGVVQVPGGAGIFPQLSVAENLRVAGWLRRHDDRASAGFPGGAAATPRAAPRPKAGGNGDGAAPALEVDEVTRSFGGVRAVDRVSLAVNPGEVVGIIGPNGAGKTTLFDLVCGFVSV